MTEELQDFRKRLDEIDNELISLLAKRIMIAKEIGKWKASQGLEIRDPEREAQLREKLTHLGSNMGLSQELIQDLFGRILEESRKVQEQ